MLDLLVSAGDLTQLITKCVDAPENLRFDIVHGISNSAFKRLDISHAREVLGYSPTDEVKPDMPTCELPVPVPLVH
jgi:hypothetical protein